MSKKLLEIIRKCKECQRNLPHHPRPVLNFSSQSRILIVGQAPGVKVHESGIPWDDASGKRLREWLGVDSSEFYKAKNFAIVPMGFCYPGRGKSGDLPPRPECSELWMEKVLKSIKKRELTLLIGQYAQEYFLGEAREKNLTETVRNWKNYGKNIFVLPHPSPRNNIWMKKNGWFERDLLPTLKKRVNRVLVQK